MAYKKAPKSAMATKASGKPAPAAPAKAPMKGASAPAKSMPFGGGGKRGKGC